MSPGLPALKHMLARAGRAFQGLYLNRPRVILHRYQRPYNLHFCCAGNSREKQAPSDKRERRSNGRRQQYIADTSVFAYAVTPSKSYFSYLRLRTGRGVEGG